MIIINLVVMLKAQGWAYREIKKATGLGETTVLRILREARERDQLKDVLADLDHDIVPQAVDNYRRAVRRGNLEISGEVLRGRGVLVTHQKSNAMTASLTRLEVVYKNVPGEAPHAEPPSLGRVVGTPLAE